MRSRVLPPLMLLAMSSPVQALDLHALWDFGNPALSEQRLRQALAQAQGDEALILHTQIARSHGLRKDFDAARSGLLQIQTAIGTAGPEARVRYHLEFGRTHASAAHDPKSLTPEAKAQARHHFEAALGVARGARLDALAIDAIHMFAFIDTAPADQLKWGQAALEVVLSSTQDSARRWEASVRNNIGVALGQLGRHGEALAQFLQALAIRERGTNAQATRVAHWMVARTLRSLQRSDEAVAIQLRLEREFDAAGQPDPYVFEELEALYRARGDADKAEHYKARRAAAGEP
ncbi:MAG: tetratricopeptide repeat protein [Betaproteobacteria bacterium]